MNEFLKSRNQIDLATKWLEENLFQSSGISCKNWEIYEVAQYFSEGDWLDMGSDGSVVLPNLVRDGISGKKYGIDLAYTEGISSPDGYILVKGNLMSTPFEDGSFDNITSLSVLEHQVDFELFAKEVSRLLRVDGRLFVSFDFWEPKPDTSKMKLYSLDWNILDKNDVINLVDRLGKYGLEIAKPIDWKLGDAVINPRYCSPASVEYTFGILSFRKK